MRGNSSNWTQDFEIGQIVSLRSGGPQMTIKVLRRARALCIWFDRTDRLCEAEFELEHLQLGKVRSGLPQRISLPPALLDGESDSDDTGGRLS